VEKPLATKVGGGGSRQPKVCRPSEV